MNWSADAEAKLKEVPFFVRPAVRKRIDACGKDIRLEVDGGIKVDNIRRVADAGADTFVAGSAIFGKPDYKKVIEQMRQALAH